MASVARALPTAADLLRLDPGKAWEIVGGEIVEKAAPTFAHGDAQSEVDAFARQFARKGGGDRPGGWWIATEVEVAYEGGEVYRHDLVGWRRDRSPARPDGWPVALRPDWACEILSPGTERRDRFEKLATLQRVGVPWYWLVELQSRAISCFRWTAEGYLLSRVGLAGGKARIEPFEAVEMDLGRVFGEEEE